MSTTETQEQIREREMVSVIEKLSEYGIKVEESAEKGRYCVAAKKFAKGDLILIAEPDAESPFLSALPTHCCNCYKVLAPDYEGNAPTDPATPPEHKVYCPGCRYFNYCSEECRAAHWKKEHCKECQYIAAIPEMSILLERMLNNGCNWQFLRTSANYNPEKISDDYIELFADFRKNVKNIEKIPDDATLYLMAETINNNAFAIEDVETGTAGTGVYILASLFSHSCITNTSRTFRDKKLYIIAAADIEVGEEITVTYSSCFIEDAETRREELKKSYGFKCMCPRCVGEDDTSSDYFKKVSGAYIPLNAEISLERLKALRPVVTEKETAEDYVGALEAIEELIPVGTEIPEVYVPSLAFGFVIERACVVSNRLSEYEDELYFTKLYIKCSTCKY